MKIITSRSNPLYRQWLAELKHAGRPGHPIWLEGVHLCEALLAHGGQMQWALFAQEAQGSGEIQALAQRVDLGQQVWMPQKLLDGLSSMVTPSSVMFLAQRPSNAQTLYDNGPPLGESSLWLDDIQDPGNVGTLLRTAAAAGVNSVFASVGTAACWSPKVLRAGQGAQFALNIHEGVDLLALLSRWQSCTDRPLDQPLDRPLILATALDATAKSLYDLDLKHPVAWIFGHEGRGVAPALQRVADYGVYIPHDRNAVESLNVSSAAAVCLFEQRRQLLAQGQ